MAYIILPSRRTRQPQDAVQKNNAAGRGLVALISILDGRPFECISSQFFTANIGAVGQAFPGKTFPTDARSVGGTGAYLSSVPNRTAADDISGSVFTIACEYSPGNDEYKSIIGSSEPSNGYGLALYHDDYSFAYNSVRLRQNLSSSWGSGDGSLGIGSENYSHRVVVVSDGGNIAFYTNNSISSVAATPNIVAHANRRLVLFGDYNSAYSATIKLSFAAVWDRAISIGEAKAVLNNPWQLFAPAPRRIYFGASGGGANIFESTFATSWSLSEAYSTSATLVSTYADSPTVTDSSSSSAVFSSAFAETVPVSDGPSADMGGTANRTQEESFTITDAYSANMVANVTISETLSAEASASASAIFNATFAETLPIVDGEEADAGRISDIAENVSVTDAYTAGIVAQATQAESVTTIDTYDTIAIYNPTLAETLPITDAVGATLTVPTSGTVDLSQESIDSLAHEIMVQLTSTPVRKL